MTRPRVAFVVQRYGTDVSGGAEAHCRMIVEKMKDLWEIEVLTSCAKHLINRFENDYKPGIDQVNGVPVRRFWIDYLRSDDQTFSRLDQKVLNRKSSREEDRLWLKEVGPYSSDLISYVQEHGEEYDVFVFFGYLYASTTCVLPIVKEKAYLVPTSHDEPPIYARFYDDFFRLPRGLIVSTQEELAFLQKRSPSGISPSVIVGVGMEVPDGVSGHLFRQAYGIAGDFLLYVGRVQKEKGCDELLDFYLALAPELRRRYPLVLVGEKAMHIPEDAHVSAVGFVPEDMKYSAMSGARLLIMPSRFESLNMVILESWLCGTPVLVNGRCDVLRGHCQRSHGGLWYTSFEEFQVCLEWMLADKDLLEILAENGRKYTGVQYSWDRVRKQYVQLVEEILQEVHCDNLHNPL
ncbi:MAG: hypothetical protein QG552_2069 [Thermodesulfobacteriota bacterium]|nr:hypothetical protein [Thermodesulfobacteriota bacterium]